MPEPKITPEAAAFPRALHRKLAQVFHEAERIPKRGKAPQAMGGYSFVQVGDAADVIRKALADKVLTMMPTKVTIVGQVDRPTKSGGSMTTVDLIVEWTISDGETGESIVIQSFGAGADGGDKYSGKAMTSAMKYALLSGFLLSTGDDTELGGEESSGPPPPAVQTEHLIGELTRTGTIERGDGNGSDLQAHVTPDGHLIGFRLKTSKGNIAQVWAQGDLAETLFAAASLDTEKLLKEKATVHGLVYDVRQPGRTTFQRLKLTRIEVLGVIIPPNPISPIRTPEAEASLHPAQVAYDAELPKEEAAELDALEVPWPDVVKS